MKIPDRYVLKGFPIGYAGACCGSSSICSSIWMNSLSTPIWGSGRSPSPSPAFPLFTQPLLNLTMLVVSLPVLICRDARAMKSALLVSFALTVACFVTTFFCKIWATEVVLVGRFMPQLWAWLPIFIFLPIAFIELDAMRI